MAVQLDPGTGETHSLIASDKVEGTAVYRPNGDKIGRIERVMIDKQTGKVAYAIMSFGGFMGIGQDYYPLPWSLLEIQPAARRLRGQHQRCSSSKLRRSSRPARPGTETPRGRTIDDCNVPPYRGV